MSGGLSTALGVITNPFDVTGANKSKKKAAQAEASAATAQAELDAKNEAEQLAADEAQAAEDAKIKADELDATKTAARQAGIAGMSDTLAKEGEATGRRRFLTGAK